MHANAKEERHDSPAHDTIINLSLPSPNFSNIAHHRGLRSLPGHRELGALKQANAAVGRESSALREKMEEASALAAEVAQLKEANERLQTQLQV